MLVNDSDGKVIFETEGVVGKFLSKSKHCECVKLEIQRGKRIEKHLVSFAATFYVVSGEGLYLDAAGETPIMKGSLLEADADTERGFENTGSSLLEVLVVKHPE